MALGSDPAVTVAVTQSALAGTAKADSRITVIVANRDECFIVILINYD
jgi:hypothetical protein